mgnify:CR=1 FL=1
MTPLTVLLQQGGQVKDQFGGLRPTFAALTGAITPTGLALGSAAVALTAVAMFGTTLFIPLFMQAVIGQSATGSGASRAMALVTGWSARPGSRWRR